VADRKGARSAENTIPAGPGCRSFPGLTARLNAGGEISLKEEGRGSNRKGEMRTQLLEDSALVVLEYGTEWALSCKSGLPSPIRSKNFCQEGGSQGGRIPTTSQQDAARKTERRRKGFDDTTSRDSGRGRYQGERGP